MRSKIFIESLTNPTYDANEMANLCGTFHQNIQIIESHFNVRIHPEHSHIKIKGTSAENVKKASHILKILHGYAKAPIPSQTIESLINHYEEQTNMTQPIQLGKKSIIPRNAKQSGYLNGINQNDLTFAIGPAGTGKTYLAVAKAIECFERGEVQRLVFVRPAVEAGEKLGFLPGDLVEKVLPYLRPIYDALYEMVGFKEAQKLIQSDMIEVLPLAFMRGRTLNDAFVILDEAQNTTIAQMKMFLTRIGFGSKAVVTGDITQIDLPSGTLSGLPHAVKLLKNTKGIVTHHFTSQEVVRHPLVAKIIDCYDKESQDHQS